MSFVVLMHRFEEHDIINVLELAKNNQLEYLQWKVEYLRNDIEMLEVQKEKATNDILKLNRIIDEFQETLAQKRGEVNQEPGRYDNIENLYPIAYQEPDTSSYSIRLSYSQMNDAGHGNSYFKFNLEDWIKWKNLKHYYSMPL